MDDAQLAGVINFPPQFFSDVDHEGEGTVNITYLLTVSSCLPMVLPPPTPLLLFSPLLCRYCLGPPQTPCKHYYPATCCQVSTRDRGGRVVTLVSTRDRGGRVVTLVSTRDRGGRVVTLSIPSFVFCRFD